MEKKSAAKKFYMHKISSLINIRKIVTIHYQELLPHYVYPEESHDFWEIIYADKDDITITRGGIPILLCQGEMLFIKPNEPHIVESLDKSPNIFIISFSCRSESMSYFCEKKCSVPEKYRYLLQIIMSEARETFYIPDFNPDLNELKLREDSNLGGEQMIKNSLETLLIYILRNENKKRQTEEFFVSKIALSTELPDEIVRILSSKVYGKLNLKDICTELHYGKTRLCTLFKEQTGKSIYQTYEKMKADEAKKLIRSKMSFPEIADALCFDSTSSFSNSFKKITGMTPGEYRESIK